MRFLSFAGSSLWGYLSPSEALMGLTNSIKAIWGSLGNYEALWSLSVQLADRRALVRTDGHVEIIQCPTTTGYHLIASCYLKDSSNEHWPKIWGKTIGPTGWIRGQTHRRSTLLFLPWLHHDYKRTSIRKCPSTYQHSITYRILARTLWRYSYKAFS